MEHAQRLTLAEMREFVASSSSLTFTGAERKEIYGLVERTLQAHEYHPLLLFNQHGDCLAAKLRPGNVHSAEDWDELLLPEIEQQQAAGKQVTLRGDAAFAKPEIYESSEERGVQYAIRIPANKSLDLEIEDILFRPPGRPSRRHCHVNCMRAQRTISMPFQAAALALSHMLNASARSRLKVGLLSK